MTAPEATTGDGAAAPPPEPLTSGPAADAPAEVQTEKPAASSEETPNPFSVSPTQLDDLFAQRNLDALAELGGIDGVAAALKCDAERGLAGEEEEARRTVFGENRLPPVRAKNIFQLMWLAMHDKILILLSIAALVSLAIGIYQDVAASRTPSCGGAEARVHWVEGLSILIAVMIVVLAGSINDYQKERQFRKLNARKEDRKVVVVRNGEQTPLSIFHVLVGDVLCLEPGEVIVADGLFLRGSNLKCDESAATGESDALKKSRERDPFLLSGSKVIEGVGRYLVTNVGVHSFHGRTMMALRTPDQDTPLQAKLDNLAETIAKLGAGVAALMLFTLIIKYVIVTLINEGFGPNCATQECGSEAAQQIVNIFITAITIVVVAVPEGLPLAVTLALAYAMTRMQKDNNLVRQLAACETMGGASCVCSDKTGTLTQNDMTVVRGTFGRNLHFGSAAAGALVVRKATELDARDPGKAPRPEKAMRVEDVVRLVVENCAINSSAFYGSDERSGDRALMGSKTECALLKFVDSLQGPSFQAYRDSSGKSVTQVYPFSSERKSMTTIVKILPRDTSDAGEGPSFVGAAPQKAFYRVYVKGASEIVLRYCSWAWCVPEATVRTAESTSAPTPHHAHSGSLSSQVSQTGLHAQMPPVPPVAANGTPELRRMDAHFLADYTANVINRYAEQALRTICIAYRDLSEEEFEGIVENELRPRVLHELEEQFNREYQKAMVEAKGDGSDGTGSTNDGDEQPVEDSTVETAAPPPGSFQPPELDRETLLGHPLALKLLVNTQLTCMGVVGIEDPLRPGVAEAVRACQRSGVMVRMVTGDNMLTARSIAAQCGIYTRGGLVMEGQRFRRLATPEMDRILPYLQVLARSSPTDKQILVGRLQALGEVVAVTGDGTNDGPALKMADVGFSMGIAGTEVAKEASAIILMDDNFGSIVKALMWGRCVNDSVKKFLQFQLTVNITAVTLSFVSAVADSSQSSILTAVQLLWVNLIMDTLAALALATDAPLPSVLDRPPESRTAPLILPQMWRMILGQAVYQITVGLVLYFAGASIMNLQALQNAGGPTKVPNELPCPFTSDQLAAYQQEMQLGTFIFNTFVFMQIFNMVNCRTVDGSVNVLRGALRNYYFLAIFFGVCALQAVIVQFGGQAFHTVGISGGFWAASIVIGAVSLLWGLFLRILPDGVFAPFAWVARQFRRMSFSSSRSDAAPSGNAAHGSASLSGQIPPDVLAIAQGTAASGETASLMTGVSAVGRRSVLASSDAAAFTAEQLQARANWQSAIHNVRTRLSVFQALRGSGRFETSSSARASADNASLRSHRSSNANSFHHMPVILSGLLHPASDPDGGPVGQSAN